MKNNEKNGLILCVAEKHGVDGETVRSGIREAIRAAQQSENSTARAFWDTVPADASDLDVVRLITELLRVS
ncbi:hypothetical protein [Anaeromassilibacillus senegalensis]|uniref:Sporulation initiation factor Spo0A C-terminal domain-containing protein n=1 Tax=Anaeromassilibacillus senegalensis TaxID=1673717 RepID=A0ABS9CIQ0_9FIRM|nr:hypothetical protein [Anaeromassilibacillus senegalensis]MCF2651007.1 hypothetical protein [Anaeromassilibacillus senegalensis]MDD7645674.1 hypothetical protein [Ruminococcus bromii]